MTEREFSTIVAGLKAIYSDPKYIEGKFTMDMWYGLLKDIPYDVANMATQAYMQSEKFPPTPADIRRYASQITAPKTEDMSELEAWDMVYKAMCSIVDGNAEKEFKKLPQVIQQALGNPANLKEMSVSDIDQVMSVDKSHFIRNYRASLERHRSKMQLNEGLRVSIDRLREDISSTLEVHEVEHKGIEVHESEEWVGIPDDVQMMLNDFHGDRARSGLT